MNPVVLIPFRSDNGGPRDRNLDLTLRQYVEADLTHGVISDDRLNGPTFASAIATNIAAANAGDWTVAFVNDADILVPVDQIREAIELAQALDAYVLAQDEFHYLSDRGVQQLAAGEHPSVCHQAEPPIALTGEKPFAISRGLWDRLGGYDPRFDGYAGSGVALSAAATCLGTVRRVSGPCYHLDHPLHDRANDEAFLRHCELANRYSAAVSDPDAMRALLAERHA